MKPCPGKEKLGTTCKYFSPLFPIFTSYTKAHIPVTPRGDRVENLLDIMGGKTTIICLAPVLHPFICSYYCKLLFFPDNGCVIIGTFMPCQSTYTQQFRTISLVFMGAKVAAK